ncbi:MAG: lactate utilization protein [Ruminiclostridium sp.]|nr:lactate utilization protein [Ruminiclostridium sp.]
MDAIVKESLKKRAGKVIAALEKNNMKGYLVDTAEQAKEIIKELIKDDKMILSGGSMTLRDTGIQDWLNEEYKGIYLDRDSVPAEEVGDLMRKAFTADTYFTSTNAVTEFGELYNVDGNGNRVAAMIYGPKQVIVVAGLNKIVTDLHAAVDRLETIASPANCIRLNKKTPCAMTGRCGHCGGNDRICNDYVIMAHQRDKDRIKVIFIAEELGY